jgi:hypothetical protein
MSAVRAERVKIIPLPNATNLSEDSLRAALTLLQPPGWAELIVHPAQLRLALKVSDEHRRAGLALSVMADKTLARADWRVRTKGVEVRSECG